MPHLMDNDHKSFDEEGREREKEKKGDSDEDA